MLQYARDMRGIEVGALVEAAVALPPGALHLRRGRLIQAVSIELEGYPAKTPDDWYAHACRKVVAQHLSALDEASGRVMDAVKVIGSGTRCGRRWWVGRRTSRPKPGRWRGWGIRTRSTWRSAATCFSICAS